MCGGFVFSPPPILACSDHLPLAGEDARGKGGAATFRRLYRVAPFFRSPP
jgi:hypothetical protein